MQESFLVSSWFCDGRVQRDLTHIVVDCTEQTKRECNQVARDLILLATVQEVCILLGKHLPVFRKAGVITIIFQTQASFANLPSISIHLPNKIL